MNDFFTTYLDEIIVVVTIVAAFMRMEWKLNTVVEQTKNSESSFMLLSQAIKSLTETLDKISDRSHEQHRNMGEILARMDTRLQIHTENDK